MWWGVEGGGEVGRGKKHSKEVFQSLTERSPAQALSVDPMFEKAVGDPSVCLGPTGHLKKKITHSFACSFI